MMYRRLCEGLNTKGTLIPATDNVYDHIKNFKKDHYLSLFQYNEEQKKKFYEKKEKLNPKTGQIESSINGARNINDVVTNTLVFDFDHKTNLEQAQKDTIEICERLFKHGISEECMLVTFSGNKGFGVEVQTTEDFTPEESKNVARELAGDLETHDSVIYNASRVFRIPFTKHQDSGLYKTPFTYDELNEMTIEEIKEVAKEEYTPESPTVSASLPASVLKLKEKKNIEKKREFTGEVADLDLRQKPRWLSNWKYAIQEGFFPEGSRNHSLMILGATYRGQGFNKITAYRMLKGAAELQCQRSGQERYADEQIWLEIVEQVYDSGWSGGTYAEDSFSDELKDYLIAVGVPRAKAEDEEEAFLDVSKVYDTFENFAENIEKNTIKTGIDQLDRLCRITTSMLVGILGCPAAGKTATVLNILEKHSSEGEASIMFSFDMGKPLLYQKFAQKQTGMDSNEIFKVFVDKNQQEKDRIKKVINDAYENVQMCFKTGSTVDDMKKYIIDFEQKTGKKVRMIAVDYLEKLVGPFSDATANSGYNAAKLQELCNELELCCLLLLQPQKMAGDPSDPLLTYRRVKGASVIEQDCRVVISLFREGYHPQSYDEDNFISYAVLKNTMGTLGQVDCYWEGRTGDVHPIDDEGKAELKALRKRKAEKKALDDL